MGKYWRIDTANCCFWEIEGRTLKGKTTPWKLHHIFIPGMAATYCITRTVMESFCLVLNKPCSAGRKRTVSYGWLVEPGKDIRGEKKLKQTNKYLNPQMNNSHNNTDSRRSGMNRCQTRKKMGKKPLKDATWVAVLGCCRRMGPLTWYWRWLVAAPLKAA